MGRILTLQRDYTLSTAKGHIIEFKKGVPTYVPDSVISDALAIGAMPEDGEINLEGPEIPTPSAPLDMGTRLDKLQRAIQILVARNERGDFTAAGAPSVSALSKILGWSPSAREVQAAWTAYHARASGAD